MIEVRGLTKRYGRVLAVDALNAIPFRRVDEVLGLVASFMTGSIVTVDGGCTATFRYGS